MQNPNAENTPAIANVATQNFVLRYFTSFKLTEICVSRMSTLLKFENIEFYDRNILIII